MSGWGGLHDPNAAPSYTLIAAGLGLYGAAVAYSILYNYNATKSAILAMSTSMLQQLAVLGLILLFLRWSGNSRRSGSRRKHMPIRMRAGAPGGPSNRYR
jgi:hypothetical protein